MKEKDENGYYTQEYLDTLTEKEVLELLDKELVKNKTNGLTIKEKIEYFFLVKIYGRYLIWKLKNQKKMNKEIKNMSFKERLQLFHDFNSVIDKYEDTISESLNHMTKESEKELIKKRFDHYYYNCDNWSIGEIETQLRIDFWEPMTMTQKECFEYISELTN